VIAIGFFNQGLKALDYGLGLDQRAMSAELFFTAQARIHSADDRRIEKHRAGPCLAGCG